MKNGNNSEKKFNFLFISNEALSQDLAWQIKKEGHKVKFYIKQKTEKDVGDGFFEKVESFEEHVDWADVIIFDDNETGELADKLRREGKFVVGGTAYTDKLEDDREFGQKELKDVGVNILQHNNFTDFDSAIEFVKSSPARYVIKPSGSAQNEKELLFVGQEEDGKDVLQVLEHYKKNWAKKIKLFQIQKYVSGVEIAVGAFFNGVDFIYPINVNFEHKRLFNGEIGPSTGEMGTLVYWSQPNIIFENTLEKMRQKLIDTGYIGYVDINCIANAKGIYPLEFTSRFGYPLLSIMMEGVISEWGSFMHALASKQPFDLKTKRGFQIGVVIAVPPFPFKDLDSFRRYSEDAVIMFKKPVTEGIHIGDVKMDDHDWKLAGQSGYALVVTGSGSTVEAARKQTYNRVENIMIPNMFYRTDIGTRWYSDSDKLQTWGYLY